MAENETKPTRAGAEAHTGEALLAGFAMHGRRLAVYVDAEGERQRALLAQWGKHRMGKVCMYFRQLRLGVVMLATMTGIGCSTAETARDTMRDSAAPFGAAAAPSDSASMAGAGAWYDRTRMLDLTGDGQPDSARLVAEGRQTDSLRITLTLSVAGAVKHRERWGSSYELALLDSADRESSRVAGMLRARLDSVLASVVVERLDAPGVRLMAEDSATLAALAPRPAHRISFAYGYESTARLVWDAANARFVRLWSCC